MTRILLTALAGAVLSGILGFLLLPVLRALKAGQSIREVGPTWHNYKAGTPMMGGLMFIAALIICLLIAIPTMEAYSVFYVLAMALCFGLIGILDDFCKMKKKQNEGLTSIQKFLLQLAVSALFLYIMYKTGGIETVDGKIPLYIPFFTQLQFPIHPLVYILFAMFVMVGCTNAVNLTDGVDGLSSSVTIPVMIFFAAAAVLNERMDLALMPACLVGVVYIMETLSVILQVGYFKLTHGKRLFKMAPIHHHFEMSGWKEEKIVLVFAGVSAVMCAIAWFGIM